MTGNQQAKIKEVASFKYHMAFFNLPLVLLAGLALPGNLLADDLDRLFFTPSERQTLERMRKSGTVGDVSTRTLVVNGYVRRSSGQETAWINGKTGIESAPGEAGLVPGGATPPELVIRPPQGNSRRMKVGQVLDLDTGQVIEGFQRRDPPRPVQAETPVPNAGKPPPPVPAKTAKP